MNPCLHCRVLVIVVTVVACSAVMAQSMPNQNEAPATQPDVKRWEAMLKRWAADSMPGLTETKDDTALFLISHRIARHLEAQNELIKTASPGREYEARVSDNLYALADMLIIGRNLWEWRVTICQANSRQRAHSCASGFGVTNAARPTANVHWEDEKIGDMSFGYHVGDEKTAWRGVVFFRGNIAVRVSSPLIEDGKDQERDPRPVAALIDKYILDGPKVEGDAKGIAVITLTMQETPPPRKEAQAGPPVVGRAYRLTFSPGVQMDKKIVIATQPAEGVPPTNGRIVAASEMRIRATHAEIVREPEGAIQVTFLAPGKQALTCEYIDQDGKIVARGTLEVAVEKDPGLRGKSGATEASQQAD